MRKGLLLASAILLPLGLAACGEDTGGQQADQPADQPTGTTQEGMAPGTGAGSGTADQPDPATPPAGGQ
ncbi:hypothetical protein [Telmatospirillum sp. J64-1]|uniref:hypothetical protein n=1 Tax=Telmatospirillum sp. J64-1 TaxID=2502183 RepID=UPI00115DFB5F|nr:hypothetical protein [Telmatospirillum sp. J64-1]